MFGLCSLVLVDGGLYWLVFIVSRKRLAYTGLFFIGSSGQQAYDGLCSLVQVMDGCISPVRILREYYQNSCQALSHMTILCVGSEKKVPTIWEQV